MGEHSGGKIFYNDQTTLVMPGDEIETRVWVAFFKKKRGKIVYVPGISKFNAEMEFNGLTWVGIKLEDGMALGSLVDPKTKCLKKAVRFLGRGEASEELPSGPLED